MKTPDNANPGPDADFDPELDPRPTGGARASQEARLDAALTAAKDTATAGEDPFEYDLTVGAGPVPTSEAQVYVEATEAAKRQRRDTLELVDKVEIAPAADPRRAVTQRVQVPAAATDQRSSHPPPVTPPPSGGPGSVQRARRRQGWWMVVAMGALVGVGAVVSRLRPAQVEGASQAGAAVAGGASSSSSTKERSAPSAIPAGSARTPAAAATVPEAPPVSKEKSRPAGRSPAESFDDPYKDAAVPAPVRTAAPSAQPAPSPPPSTNAIVPPAQPAPAASASSHIFVPVPPY